MTTKGSFPVVDAPGNLFVRIQRETPKGGFWFKLSLTRGSSEEGAYGTLPEMLYAESLFEIPAACRAALN